MKRLAFAIHDLNNWGGHDRSTLEIARRLSHRWPVDVFAFTLNDPRGLSSWGDVKFHQIRPNISHPVLVKSTWYYGATLFLLSALGKSRPLIHATGSCSLLSDVVQVQFVNAAWKDARKALPETRKNGPRDLLKSAYHEVLLDYNVCVEHAVYSKKKTYIAISHGVAKELKDYFGVENQVHVIHHGVDPEMFRPGTPETRAKIRSEHGIKETDVALLFVGTYERKGLGAAIESLAKLKPESRKRVKLLAVGEGPAMRFQSLAEKLGVQDQLVLVGHTKNIIPYYQAADLFLLPTHYEPFGLVITEAMSCALAPVVSKIAGASELVENEKSGMLIENPADSEEIARLLEPLISNEKLRVRMGEQARKIAAERNWDRVADEYAKVLEPLL